MQIQDKVPQYQHFLKNPIHVVAYVLLLYFIYKEFNSKDDCSTIIAKYEIVLSRQEDRIQKLENYVDIKNGVIKEIEKELDSAKTER